MLKVVFDTVVFVRSLINPYSWWGKIIFQHSDHYRLFVSQLTLQEVFEVLQRPEITSLFHSLEGLDKRRMIEIITEAETVEISDVPAVSRDIKDDKFLATAKTAGAHYLVSADRDLLDLKEYEGVKVVTAEEFLQIFKEYKNTL
ncbi:MAG: putative toxin-antitoxin system toxin component, PIN family [bacterium]|nr:putative toxin-antitoxin system toxin component, PIN family [bacterium]